MYKVQASTLERLLQYSTLYTLAALPDVSHHEARHCRTRLAPRRVHQRSPRRACREKRRWACHLHRPQNRRHMDHHRWEPRDPGGREVVGIFFHHDVAPRLNRDSNVQEGRFERYHQSLHTIPGGRQGREVYPGYHKPHCPPGECHDSTCQSRVRVHGPQYVAPLRVCPRLLTARFAYSELRGA